MNKYFKCFDEKGNLNGLKFEVNHGVRLKNNPKIELSVLQSCFGHLDAVMDLFKEGFKFVGNFVGCDRCSSKDNKCCGFGKIWTKDGIYISGCNGCGFVNIMQKLN